MMLRFLFSLVFILVFHLSLSFAEELKGHENERRGHNEENHGPRHKEESHDEHAQGVHLGQESQQMVGLALVKAVKAPMVSILETVGEIAQDTENVVHITCKHSGILESIKVRLGDTVEKGMPVCVVKAKDGSLTEIVSPAHGIVLAQYLKEQDKVDETSSIMTVADPDVMKASFNIYEKDLAGIAVGQKMIVKTMAYPGQEFQGEVVYISPQVDSKTRTVKIRGNIENQEHLLKFGMYVTGQILIPLSQEAIVIPEESLQEVEGKIVVFIPQEKEEFAMRPVVIGQSAAGKVEVIDGLNEGDVIVGQGSYYLKAELLKGELEEGHAH